MYVFDSGAFIHIFRYYYTDVFKSFWENFEKLINEGKIISVMEVQRELEGHEDRLANWVKNHKHIFLKPDQSEVDIIKHIYANAHLQHNIKKKDQYQYCNEADPFVVAKAKVKNCYVVSTEVYKKDGAKVPNLCEYEKVEHLSVEEFMKQESWQF